MKITQNQRVLDYMREFGSITQLEAIRDIACYRLASRVSDLRRKGVDIKSERVIAGKQYSLNKSAKPYSSQEKKQKEH